MKNGNVISASAIAVMYSALFTGLLLNGYLNQVTYGAMMVATGIISLAFFGFPRLRELDVKGGRLVLAEVRQLYSEILAKHADLRDLAELLVDLSALLTSGDLHYRLPVYSMDKVLCRETQRIKARDRGLDLLARLGTPAHTVARIREAFNIPVRQAITHVMCSRICHCVDATAKRLVALDSEEQSLAIEPQTNGTHELAQERAAMQKQRMDFLRPSISKRLFPLYFGPAGSRTKLKQHLEPLGLWSTELDSSLDKLETLLQTAQISPTNEVPADDSRVLYTGI